MASSSSGTGKFAVGANGSSNSNTKKVIRVSLDTSDTINLNHLDVLPMQLVETLDRNIEEVNVKLKTPENKKPNDSSDAINPNETYTYNRDRAPCGNINLNLYSTCSDIINQNQKLRLLKNPNNNPNKTTLSSSSRKKRNSDYSTLSRENMTNARVTTRKHKTKVVNASPSFDRFGRMTRITTNFAENSETSVSECQVRMDKKKRQPVRVNLADILPLSDSLSISDTGNNGSSNRASEESWSAGVPETVQKDIVKKIMDLGLDLKSGIKSSHALRKLQEALQDLQNDWQSDFTRSSPTIPNPNSPTKNRDRARNRRNEQEEAEYISEDSQSGSADSSPSGCLRNAKTTKNTSKENKHQIFNLSSEDYKPPVAVSVTVAAAMNQNQLQKSQQVLTLCPNRADLFTCHSSDCSVSDFLVTEASVAPRSVSVREPPLSPTSSRIQEIKQKLLSSPKPIADYQDQGQRSLTPQSEAPTEPKLSPEKVAAIWNWVSPKYDQVSQQDFDLQIEVIRRKKEKLIKTALLAGEKQKHGKSTPTATPKKVSKTNNKHVNSSNNVGSKKIKLKPVNSNKKKIIQSQSQRTTAVTIKKIKSKIMKLKPLLTSINLLKTNTNADVAIPLKSHHHHHTPTLVAAPNSKHKQLYVPSRPSTPSLSLEYRDRDDIFDGEDCYDDIQNENDSINNNDQDHHGHYDMYPERDCHLFLSDPITQNVFSRVSFQDGSFSTDGDILPSRPFRGGPDHMDTGHLDSYVSQVLSSVNLQEQEDIVNANSNTYYENQSIIEQYEMDETNEHEPGLDGAGGTELGPVFKDKDNNDDDVNEIEADSVLERVVMTPPCTSNWNLSPLYEAIAATGNNTVNLHEPISNIKAEDFDESFEDRVSSGDVGEDCLRCEDCDCDCDGPQLHLDSSLKNDYNNNVHMHRDRNYEELTIMEQLELLEDGNGSETGATLTEWNSECECCSMSMSPLLFSADLYGSMADVHSGDEIATRCSTSSSVTEFEHQGVECVSNTNVMMQVRKLSSIRNKLRLLDLLKETVTGTAAGKKAEKDGHGEQMRTNSKGSKVDLLMTSLPLTTPTHAGSSAPAENENYSENPAMLDANADTALNLTNLVQLQCPAAAPDSPVDNNTKTQKQKLRLPFPFELNPTTTVDEESMMKQFYFLPLPPTDPIKIELTFRKSYDSMKAQPPSSAASSPSVTARFRIDPPTPTAPAFTTDVSDTFRINRNENTLKKPKTRNSDQHQYQPAPSKQNSAHALQQTTKKLSGESLSKKSRKKKTRKKNHDDPTEETGTGNCETTDAVKEKKHRKHRRHHEDGGADLKCDEDAQQSHKKRSSIKKDRSHIEKLKSILPRTPGGRYTLRGKEAEDAIADYVKAELATSLGIGFGFHGQGQGQEGHLETMEHLPISESKAKILEAGCLHDLVRSVTSSLVDNQDKKGKEMLDGHGPSNGNNKIIQQQQQVLVNNSKPKPRSKKHMDNSISGISKLLSGSKSLKILNLSKNNTHSHSNPYMAHHQTYQRVIASTAAARKRMSVGVIPKQSTRPNFLRYQQQSIAAMINISKARASHYVKGYGSTGTKYFLGSGPGAGGGGGLGRLTNNGIGPPIFGAGSGSGSGGGGSNSPSYNNHNCSPARSNISNSTYQQYQRLPPHHPNSLSHVRLKANRRNAVTVVFDSTATGNTVAHRE